jgi:hypothetical protein
MRWLLIMPDCNSDNRRARSDRELERGRRRAYAQDATGRAEGRFAEGHKTVRGNDWTTRRLRETVLSPYLAGWITVYAESLKGDLDAMS